jgi:hypothetical protein
VGLTAAFLAIGCGHQGGSMAADVAQRLQGTWKLDSRIVSDGTSRHTTVVDALTIYDFQPANGKEITGTVMTLESGVIDAAVEDKELFMVHPEFDKQVAPGESYSLGAKLAIRVTDVVDPRCGGSGEAAAMSFDGQLEGSYAQFKQGCVSSDGLIITLCPNPFGGYSMVGVADSLSGVQGVTDSWTGFEGLEHADVGATLTHKLPRVPLEAGAPDRMLIDNEVKLSRNAVVTNRTSTEYWDQLIADHVLTQGKLNVTTLLKTM